MENMENIETYRKNALEAARYYSEEVKEKIKKAKTEGEITRALIKGRSEL